MTNTGTVQVESSGNWTDQTCRAKTILLSGARIAFAMLEIIGDTVKLDYSFLGRLIHSLMSMKELSPTLENMTDAWSWWSDISQSLRRWFAGSLIWSWLKRVKNKVEDSWYISFLYLLIFFKELMIKQQNLAIYSARQSRLLIKIQWLAAFSSLSGMYHFWGFWGTFKVCFQITNSNHSTSVYSWSYSS